MIHRSLFLLLAAALLSFAQPAVEQKLAGYRTEIDLLDRQIVELLNKRAAVVHEVGKLKKEAGLPVTAPAREKQVLDRVAEAGRGGPLPEAVLRKIYETVLAEMRNWEAAVTGASR